MAGLETEEYPMIWLQGAGCSGCSVSLLNSVSPTVKNALIDEVIPGKHVNLRFHPTIMAGAGEVAIKELERAHQEGGYILVMEGAIPLGAGGSYCVVGEKEGQDIPLAWWVEGLSGDALAVLAVGTCAAFGGIPAAAGNPTNCVGVRDFFASRQITTPLINLPGCPPHPDWFMGTLASVLLFGLPKPEELDVLGRPKAFYGGLVHENCPRRAYFDEGKFAKSLSDEGCLYELGCKGPVTHADCPTRHWNHGLNWCVGSGAPCIGCTEPTFPYDLGPLYERIADEDMPGIGEQQVVKG